MFDYSQNTRMNEKWKRINMERILSIAVLFAHTALCSVYEGMVLDPRLEEASLLLHNLSRQHLLWQCNAIRAPSNARRLASCQQAVHEEAEAVVLKLPTLRSLGKVLSQLAEPNGFRDEVSN